MWIFCGNHPIEEEKKNICIGCKNLTNWHCFPFISFFFLKEFYKNEQAIHPCFGDLFDFERFAQ